MLSQLLTGCHSPFKNNKGVVTMIRFVLDFYRSRFSLKSASLFKMFIDFVSSVLKCYHFICSDNLKLETLFYTAVYLVYSLGFLNMD